MIHAKNDINNWNNPMLAVFKIYTGEAHFWTMENNIREEHVERVKF
jgi:hypothetical protein